jgi:hypothetical protein
MIIKDKMIKLMLITNTDLIVISLCVLFLCVISIYEILAKIGSYHATINELMVRSFMKHIQSVVYSQCDILLKFKRILKSMANEERVLTYLGENKNISITVCYYAASKFLYVILICNGIKKEFSFSSREDLERFDFNKQLSKINKKSNM